MTVRVPGRLHVLTDETLQSRFSHLELASLAIEGGADVVQFREKRSRPRAALVELVREIAGCVHDAHAILVVNDRVELALEAGADGVHLGAGDAAPGFARGLLGPRAWIGGTANDLERVRKIAGTPLDYLGVGPVFGTSSKFPSVPPLGLLGLRRIVNATDRPVVAIGNLTPDRVASVLAAGAHGVAVLSDVVCHADPAGRVRQFVEALERGPGSGNRREEQRVVG